MNEFVKINPKSFEFKNGDRVTKYDYDDQAESYRRYKLAEAKYKWMRGKMHLQYKELGIIKNSAGKAKPPTDLDAERYINAMRLENKELNELYNNYLGARAQYESIEKDYWLKTKEI